MPQERLAPEQSVTVKLPAVLVDLFPGSERVVCVEATTVGEMIDALDRRWPGMADRIRDSRPAVRKHINIFVEGARSSLSTPLRAGSTVFVITAISGG
ncbi:MoaD/ThiS family protein [Pararhizobium haloflavum]|uniref:MoaD/ThiS family protein n=1 Tax=Pararhizobium haloflavum TaxID=2037914 RepID=UPI000C19D674|nr:MoaD/ThiS family protein [Pararhizobium haloflavum]